jgi:NAD(P)-dependent dehydrogenase (short-subunit alcohol dehydrogenase family)
VCDPENFAGKLVLVTGASSGIGRATALLLAACGARVVLSGRRAEALLESRSAMRNPERHLLEVFDLSDTDAISGWLKDITARAGSPLDGLVHAAGAFKYVPLRTSSRKLMDEIFAANLFAAIALMRGSSARGIAHDGASFVFVSSIAGRTANPGLLIYGASKAALESAVRTGALELKERRIRLNCVSPGFVQTPMFERAKEIMGASLSKLEERQFAGLAEADEVARTCLFLLSEQSRQITGATIVMDGGFSL